jgi:hypothetical protein
LTILLSWAAGLFSPAEPSEAARNIESILSDEASADFFLMLDGFTAPNHQQLEDYHQSYLLESIEETFRREWGPHIAKRAQNMKKADSEIYAKIAYGVVAAAEYAMKARNESTRRHVRKAPLITPRTRLRRHFDFEDIDFLVMNGNLRHPVSSDALKGCRTVAACAERVFRYAQRNGLLDSPKQHDYMSLGLR